MRKGSTPDRLDPDRQACLTRLPDKVAAPAMEFTMGGQLETRRVGNALRRELKGLYDARRGDFRPATVFVADFIGSANGGGVRCHQLPVLWRRHHDDHGPPS